MKTIRIGTRTSALAMRQTELVMEVIKATYPESTYELVPIKTKGDQLLHAPLTEFGGKGAFVTEFEEALRQGEIDLAVHSAKDMPMRLGESLALHMVLPREDVRDVLLSRRDMEEEQLYRGVIGTSSPRRALQIRALYPVECRLLRGNVTTRIEKLRQGQYDGILLAAAGLKRLGLEAEEDLRYRYLTCEEMIPAGGQGIIAVEGREEDSLRELLRACSDRKAELELETERYVLEQLQAGCHEAVGVLASLEEGGLRLRIAVESPGGLPEKGTAVCHIEDRYSMADSLIREVRSR